MVLNQKANQEGDILNEQLLTFVLGMGFTTLETKKQKGDHVECHLAPMWDQFQLQQLLLASDAPWVNEGNGDCSDYVMQIVQR